MLAPVLNTAQSTDDAHRRLAELIMPAVVRELGLDLSLQQLAHSCAQAIREIAAVVPLRTLNSSNGTWGSMPYWYMHNGPATAAADQAMPSSAAAALTGPPGSVDRRSSSGGGAVDGGAKAAGYASSLDVYSSQQASGGVEVLRLLFNRSEMGFKGRVHVELIEREMKQVRARIACIQGPGKV